MRTIFFGDEPSNVFLCFTGFLPSFPFIRTIGIENETLLATMNETVA